MEDVVLDIFVSQSESTETSTKRVCWGEREIQLIVCIYKQSCNKRNHISRSLGERTFDKLLRISFSLSLFPKMRKRPYHLQTEPGYSHHTLCSFTFRFCCHRPECLLVYMFCMFSFSNDFVSVFELCLSFVYRIWKLHSPSFVILLLSLTLSNWMTFFLFLICLCFCFCSSFRVDIVRTHKFFGQCDLRGPLMN